MAIYEVTTKGVEAKRLVEADSAAKAIRHCSTGQYAARTVTKASEIAAMFQAGVKLEDANAEPVVETDASDDKGGTDNA